MPDYGQYCSNWSYEDVHPLISLNSYGQIRYQGGILAVGSSPTAVKAYRVTTETYSWESYDYSYYEERTQPSRALVVNSGSNSVSVIDLVTWTLLATIPVGSRPTGLLIAPDESRAYVVNHDSSTLTEIGLTTNSVTRTVGLNYHPRAISLDPGGAAVWVGGQGWISKIDLGSLGHVASYQVNGTITSLGTSVGQNSLVYTAITNSSAPSSTYGATISYPASNYSVRQLRLSDMSTIGEVSGGSASAYQYSAAVLAAPSALAGGTKVSLKYSNAISVSATPSGFVVMDVSQRRQRNHERQDPHPRSLDGGGP